MPDKSITEFVGLVRSDSNSSTAQQSAAIPLLQFDRLKPFFSGVVAPFQLSPHTQVQNVTGTAFRWEKTPSIGYQYPHDHESFLLLIYRAPTEADDLPTPPECVNLP